MSIVPSTDPCLESLVLCYILSDIIACVFAPSELLWFCRVYFPILLDKVVVCHVFMEVGFGNHVFRRRHLM